MNSVPIARFRSRSQIYEPLCSLAHKLAGLSGWRRYGIAFLLGVTAAAALPPVDLSPLLVVAFSGILWLDEGSSCSSASFGLGYAFGFGFFVAGLYWISGALFVDIATFWWLVPIAVLGIPAVLSLYAGIVFLITNIANKYLRLSKTARVFGFAIFWTSAEWIRGHAFTGTPLEPNRVNLVGRVSRCNRDPAVCRLDWHLWVEFYYGTRRFIARAPWRIVSCPDFGASTLGSGDLGGALGTDTRFLGCASIANVSDR